MMLIYSGLANAISTDDAYLAGYANAVLHHELKQELPPVEVKDGVISMPVTALNTDDQNKAAKLLSAIPGVKAVNIYQTSGGPAGTSGAAAVQTFDNAATVKTQQILPTGILPVGLLFKPFLADPRWSHFSVAYRSYQPKNFAGGNNASVSFGETMPFYRANLGNSGAQWETGMQAGVFSDFNLDTQSKNLVNSDFTVAGYGSIRNGAFSAFGRFYHQSSHVGDEFLIAQFLRNTHFQRVNLSYEGLDLKLSYALPYGLRVYGGGTGLIDKDPSTLKTWATEYGLEFRSPWIMDLAAMRPIFAADVKNFEQNHWGSDISVRAGVEFDNTQVWGRKLQILAEYFDGNSPIGQFYQTKVQYVGLGMHFHF